MLAFIALCLSPLLIILIRNRNRDSITKNGISFLIEYAITILESNFATLFCIWYLFNRRNIAIQSFDSVPFFLKYCVLNAFIGVCLVYLEEIARADFSKQIVYEIGNKIRFYSVRVSADLFKVDKLVQEKVHFHIDEIVLLAIGLGIAILMVVRCFYGVELTDEAYYIADAYTVAQGNLPFAYNTSNTAGMTLLMMPFVYVYTWFVPDLEGVFLYMRLCFVLFRLLVLVMLYFLLHPRFSRRDLLAAMLLLLPWYGSPIANFSYNTNSVWLVFLVGVALSEGYTNEKRKKRMFLMVAAGAVSALAVFAHPLHAVSVLLFSLLLLGLSKAGEKISNLGCYYFGGGLQVFFVLFSVGMQTGFDKLLAGVNAMLFHRLRFISDNLTQDVYDFCLWVNLEYRMLLVAFLGVFVAISLMNHYLNKQCSIKDRWLFASVSAIFPVVLYFGYLNRDYVWSYFGALAFWLLLMTAWLVKDKLTVYLSLPYLVFFLAEVVFAPTGSVFGRAMYLYPIVFVMLLLLLRRGLVLKVSAVVVIFAISLMLTRFDYVYVYRDSEIPQLTCKVAAGIYKGVYTKPQKAVNTMELERYIKEHTNPFERISFRDNVPFAYLMSDGVICDIRTWDAMQYNSNKSGAIEDDPSNMYRYYKNTGTIPDKYIYIDWGQDAVVSYDDPDWKFNQWLNTYYKKTEEANLNGMYSVRIYQYDGGFDGDYNFWINTTEK